MQVYNIRVETVNKMSTEVDEYDFCFSFVKTVSEMSINIDVSRNKASELNKTVSEMSTDSDM